MNLLIFGGSEISALFSIQVGMGGDVPGNEGSLGIFEFPLNEVSIR